MADKPALRYLFLQKDYLDLSPAAADLARPPELTGIRRALFVQPHPDDNQIGAGGTIACLIERGVKVFELTVLDDRFTDTAYQGSGLTVRQREALAASAQLGTEHVGFVGFGDRTEAAEREIVNAIVPYIRLVRPDAVFTPDPTLENENHEDHVKIPRAVFYAVRDSAIGFLPGDGGKQQAPDRWRTGIIAFYFTSRPNTVVDITAYRRQKLDAMNCHASQMSDDLRRLVGLLDEEAARGTPYQAAEAFRVISYHQTHGFPFPVIARPQP